MAELETNDLAYNYILAKAFLKRKQVTKLELAQWLDIIMVSGRISIPCSFSLHQYSCMSVLQQPCSRHVA